MSTPIEVNVHPYSCFFRKFLVIAMLTLSLPVFARDIPASPSNYRARFAQLQPGDRIILAPGRYERGLPIDHVIGKPGRPVVIWGPPPPDRAVFVSRKGHNTVSIVDSAYIEIYNLELDGRGIPVDAVKAEGHAHWAHHVKLDNLLIHGHNATQQTVGISTKCPTWDWQIRNCIIAGAGTGIYLGNSDGSAPFVRGVIEYNLIVDSTGYNLEIKHQNQWPEMPGRQKGPSFTIVRHNVFSNAAMAPTGSSARPNVLLGHMPLSGPGSDDGYAVYGNFFFQNPSEALFQGEGNVALYHNVFINTSGDAVRIQRHNDVPRDVWVFHNTVIAKGIGIRVKDGAPDHRQEVYGNAVFANHPIQARHQTQNVTDTFEAASRYLVSPFGPPGGMDLRPKSEMQIVAANEQPAAKSFPDSDRDFDGRRRSERFCGAYGYGSAGGGWQLQLQRKEYRPE